MVRVSKCSGITKAGKPCRGVPVHGSQWCMSHNPDMQSQQSENRRRGGEARSNARRAIRQWAEFGKELGNEDLPSIIKSSMYAVKIGELEPAQAQAIAALARTANQLTADLELEARIQELEKAAGMTTTPANVRRIS